MSDSSQSASIRHSSADLSTTPTHGQTSTSVVVSSSSISRNTPTSTPQEQSSSTSSSRHIRSTSSSSSPTSTPTSSTPTSTSSSSITTSSSSTSSTPTSTSSSSSSSSTTSTDLMPTTQAVSSTSESSTSDSTSTSDSSTFISTSSTAASTPTQNSAISSSRSNGGAIAGGVIGGILGAALIAFLAIWWYRRRKFRFNDDFDDLYAYNTGRRGDLNDHNPHDGFYMGQLQAEASQRELDNRDPSMSFSQSQSGVSLHQSPMSPGYAYEHPHEYTPPVPQQNAQLLDGEFAYNPYAPGPRHNFAPQTDRTVSVASAGIAGFGARTGVTEPSPYSDEHRPLAPSYYSGSSPSHGHSQWPSHPAYAAPTGSLPPPPNSATSGSMLPYNAAPSYHTHPESVARHSDNAMATERPSEGDQLGRDYGDLVRALDAEAPLTTSAAALDDNSAIFGRKSESNVRHHPALSTETAYTGGGRESTSGDRTRPSRGAAPPLPDNSNVDYRRAAFANQGPMKSYMSNAESMQDAKDYSPPLFAVNKI